MNMKNLILILLLAPFAACNQQNLTPVETAQIVAESFYSGSNDKLKEYTTPIAYNNFMSIQHLFKDSSTETSFKVIQKVEKDDTVWIQYTTQHEEKPGVFKLIKEGEKWKVTDKGSREKTPF